MHLYSGPKDLAEEYIIGKLTHCIQTNYLLMDDGCREVKVEQATYASGAIFIGVAPAAATSWGSAYGFLNYRATQAFGSETLYGSYYNAGDVIGVILDMDHGTLSFIKEGITESPITFMADKLILV